MFLEGPAFKFVAASHSQLAFQLTLVSEHLRYIMNPVRKVHNRDREKILQTPNRGAQKCHSTTPPYWPSNLLKILSVNL